MTFDSFVLLIGGLGVFLFGMKLMSESLQEAAGDKLREFLSRMTRSRFSAVVSGMLMTITVQSSSATTVMVVSFVNAGLLSLIEAIGVIMGANIGTTVTAWMVAFLGFKVKIANFALPAIAIGMVMLFYRKNDRVKIWGNVLIGFGFLFLGLKFLKSAVPSAAKNPEAFAFLAVFNDWSPYSTLLIFIAIGTLLTIVVQSSSAASTITLTLAFSGHITYEQAAAMILGENIGTTITANLAALAGNLNAKMAALAHTYFNIFGIAWILILFFPMLSLVDYIVPGDPLAVKETTRFHLSAFHTLFNIFNTVILFGFAAYLAKAVVRTFELFTGQSLKIDHKTKGKLTMMSAGSVQTTGLAYNELLTYFQHNVRSLTDLFEKMPLMIEKKGAKKIIKKIYEGEKKIERFSHQTIQFIETLRESGVSGKSASDLERISSQVRSLEEIGDISRRFAAKVQRANKDKITLDPDHKDMLDNQFRYLNSHFTLVASNLENIDSDEAARQSKKFTKEVEKIYHQTLKAKIKSGSKKKNTLARLYFMDLARYVYYISGELQAFVSGRSK